MFRNDSYSVIFIDGFIAGISNIVLRHNNRPSCGIIELKSDIFNVEQPSSISIALACMHYFLLNNLTLYASSKVYESEDFITNININNNLFNYILYDNKFKYYVKFSSGLIIITDSILIANINKDNLSGTADVTLQDWNKPIIIQYNRGKNAVNYPLKLECYQNYNINMYYGTLPNEMPDVGGATFTIDSTNGKWNVYLANNSNTEALTEEEINNILI